jgi:hypothetical protein
MKEFDFIFYVLNLITGKAPDSVLDLTDRFLVVTQSLSDFSRFFNQNRTWILSPPRIRRLNLTPDS